MIWWDNDVMPSQSPEWDRASEMLRALQVMLAKLDPVEHMAHSHLDMSIDPDRDLGTLMLTYAYDEATAKMHFDELQMHFEDDYALANEILADEWHVDRRQVPWPEDESQHAATYLVDYRSTEFKISISRWTQPLLDQEMPVEIIAATIEPKLSEPEIIWIIYRGNEPLVSCKFSELSATDTKSEHWYTAELSPDDLMTAEKVIRSALLHTV